MPRLAFSLCFSSILCFTFFKAWSTSASDWPGERGKMGSSNNGNNAKQLQISRNFHILLQSPSVTPPRATVSDAVAEMDQFIGRVVEETRRLHIDLNTLFVFTSDNGPWVSQGVFGGSSGPFKGGKGTGWEGGFRMPTVMYQPLRVFPGSTQAMVSHLDWFPTFAELAGASMPTGRNYDGKSMIPLLKWNIHSPPAYDKEYVIRDSIAYYINGFLVAMRHKSFKAHFVTLDTESSVPVVRNPPLLFNVDNDIAELWPLDVTLPENQQVLFAINQVRVALMQTYAAEPPHPPILGITSPTWAVPCCNYPTCHC